MEEDMETGEGCETPKHSNCRIPSEFRCPPPPKKKTAASFGKRRDPPPSGYFHPPDLEALFAVGPRHETCA
ncbi:hypothetical protein AMTRI_Chr08g162070 [Amborella trichopoda]|uniref:Cyclin-dependent protein kinase inhibitor SMR4 n=1 Tax=Amborella trichopoda TaxID=13333 RepID=W1PJM4_AMBTC|nr:hypothetical protein AMTR_s00012p00245380 [Amborella trichopoda]